MFVMTNHGGLPEENIQDMNTAWIFVQRAFLLEILSRGISIVLLEGAEYRDAKVTSSSFNIIRICHVDLIA